MRNVVGVVGTIASGKEVLAQLFRERGFKSYSLSDIIREELSARDLPITREWLQDMGDELRREFGDEILAIRTLEKINLSADPKIVIESIRNPAELKLFKKHLGAVIIGIDASPEVRFKRLTHRDRGGEPATWEEFLEMDGRETRGSDDPHKIDIAGCMKLVDYAIKNEGTPDDLMCELNRFFRQVEETKRRRKEG